MKLGVDFWGTIDYTRHVDTENHMFCVHASFRKFTPVMKSNTL